MSRPRTTARLAALLALATLAGAAAAEERCFTGYAYHPDSGTLAYTERHQQRLVDGRPVDWRVSYHGPDGEIIARKRMDFGANRFVPTFTATYPRTGDAEGIERADDGGWRMFKREGADGERRIEDFEVTADTAGDAGFDPFVRAHFDPLMDGETVTFRFAVAGSLRVLKLRAKRIEDTRFEGEPAVRFRAELDMFLIGGLLDGLVLTYDPDTRRLLEYRGPSNMQNARGERYPVRVSYYREPPPGLATPVRWCRAGPPEPE